MDLVNHLQDKLLFAVPKKGRLNEKAMALLKGADIQFNRSHRLDIAISTNLPVALVFLPAADIPRFVGEGKCALGITGIDEVAESQMEVDSLLDLNFGKCKLQVQVPANGPFQNPEELIGKNIVTSFPRLVGDYFRKLENKNGWATSDAPLDTKVKYVGGSVEAAVALGVADAIVDLVESGETMRAAGLKPIATLLSTSAHLIGSKKPTHPEIYQIIIERIKGILAAQSYVLCTYNAPETQLPALLKITPGRRAPTITSLQEEGWKAVSVMVPASQIAKVMDELTAAKATDIIVFQISNCRV